MSKTYVLNLFGPPGAGKSTGAAYIFAKLKMAGVNAELVTEFAKDKVWEGNEAVFKNQAYIFGKQSFKISRCEDKVDVIVTDSPLFLSVLYSPKNHIQTDFNAVVLKTFNSYNNVNYIIRRVKPYNPIGRNQNEEQSDALAPELAILLEENHIECEIVDGCEEGYDKIIAEIRSKYLNQ